MSPRKQSRATSARSRVRARAVGSPAARRPRTGATTRPARGSSPARRAATGRAPAAMVSKRAGAERATRIVIADAQLMDRRGMAGLLKGQPDLEVVAEAGSIAETIAQYRLQSPDVLVLALGLRGPAGEPPVRAVRESLPGARILAVSERGASNCLVLNPPGSGIMPGPACEFATDCLQLAAVQGAQGAVRRSASPEDLFAAIRAVARGQVWYEANTAEALAGGILRPGASAESLGLSERELDVAELLSRGRSNKEIAATLSISEPTVKKHIGRVLLKLGVADRLQAGLFVARHPLMLRRDSAS